MKVAIEQPLPHIEPISNNKNSALLQKLSNIYGIGPKLAQDLIEKGVKSKTDLKKPEFFKTLPKGTQLHLKYPVAEELSWDSVHSLLSQFPSFLIGVGGYRRKKQKLHDVDILTFKPMDKTIEAIKTKAKQIDQRSQEHPFKILGDYSSGPQKHSFVLKYKLLYLRVDIFYAPAAEKPFALLHYTGSRNFNIRVRAVAKRKGFKLNQHGLFSVETGKSVLSAKTEKDVLDFLAITYKKPEERSE